METQFKFRAIPQLIDSDNEDETSDVDQLTSEDHDAIRSHVEEGLGYFLDDIFIKEKEGVVYRWSGDVVTVRGRFNPSPVGWSIETPEDLVNNIMYYFNEKNHGLLDLSLGTVEVNLEEV